MNIISNESEAQPIGKLVPFTPAAPRESQVKVGMRPDPDPEKHLATGCTFLPPPVGEARSYSCEVTGDSPYWQYTILGIDFVREVTKPVFRGTARQARYVPHKIIYNLTDNQIKAIELVAAKKKVTGWASRESKDGEEEFYEVEGTISQFIRLVPSSAEDREMRIVELEEKTTQQEKELEELRKLLA